MRIAVVGAGYVGLSAALLLARRHEVTAVDILPERVDAVNRRACPLRDALMEEILADPALHLTATTDAESALRAAELTLVATPTDFDEARGSLDTSAVESVVELSTTCNPHAPVVVRSTVPVGFTAATRERFGRTDILFCPEFLRESRALYDNLHPSRIIVGGDVTSAASMHAARHFADLLSEGAVAKNIPVLLMDSSAAEAVKLFANTYLALRVAFFNELDTYAVRRGLDSRSLVAGVCLDPRIGDHYNNPSFGYGGYCLPKDTRQLLADCTAMPQALLSAVVEANRLRKDFIAAEVAAMARATPPPPGERDGRITVGIYKLAMKAGSDNFRHAAVLDVLRTLRAMGIHILIHEPSLADGSCFEGCPVVGDLSAFKRLCRVVVANRTDASLADIADRIYTRDLFGRD